LGQLLSFSRKTECDTRENPDSCASSGDTQPAVHCVQKLDGFAEVIAGICRLSETACRIDAAALRLPDSPEKQQFDVWRRHIIIHIHQAMIRLERVLKSLPLTPDRR
jgi:hypothetical protein